MKKSVLDGLSVCGLLISLLAVCNMLAQREVAALSALYLAWGVFCVLGPAIVLLVPRIRQSFHRACASGVRLLGLRMTAALVLMLLGWYVHSASEALYGADSVQVAGNGLRMFCLIFNLVAHVVYLGFTKRPLTVEPPRATKSRRKR